MPNKLNRRQFLQRLSMFGLGAAVGCLPSTLQASAPGTLTETRLAMGTFVTVILAGSSSEHMTEGMALAFNRMNSLIGIFDRHNGGSPLGVLNSQGSLRDVPVELSKLIQRSRIMSRLTGQAFNMTVQPLVDLFRRYQNPAGQIAIPADELTAARELVQVEAVFTTHNSIYFGRQGMGLTLDGIAKGHIADEISSSLREVGLPNHLINAGGDIVAHGHKQPGLAWIGAITDPHKPSQIFDSLIPLHNVALATSGGYQTFYDVSRKHNHLINPQAGTSSTQIASASVLTSNGQDADALATALTILPARSGLALVDSVPGCECLLITAQGHKLTSPGWPII